MSVYSDWAILAIFTLEMFLKMIAFGIGYKPPLEPDVEPELAGYFAGAWNRLDSFIGNNFSKVSHIHVVSFRQATDLLNFCQCSCRGSWCLWLPFPART